ncbi:MAG TPA: HAMP domain-containing sensor histidine kinase [Bryobacteraceae bacterium]|nr:HAMP domain-containing sensor histidine kinase [Bryobacteraceae bacterium]
MWRERLREYVFPGEAERNPEFRAEMQRLGRLSLRVLGAVQIGASLFMLGARFLVAPETSSLTIRFRQALMISAVGIVDIAASRLPGISRWSRGIAIASALLVAAILIWSSFVIAAQSTAPNDFIPGEITMIVLFAVTIVPLRPMQSLLLGSGIGVIYMLEAMAAERTLLEGLGPDDNYMLFILMLTLLSTAITAVVYGQRRAGYEHHRQSLQAAEDLRKAQTRILLTENAASLSRLAAAVSHEMNNPLGALVSGVDTLLLLAARQATCGPEEQHRLVRLQADLRRSIQESAQRLKELVGRMQRFTNLDQAEEQPSDLNELLRDVAALMDPRERGSAQVELRLDRLPPVLCRPQQMSAVFSSLLRNAVEAVDGQGRVVVSTATRDSTVEVRIEDNGRGLSSDELATIFDPGFRESGGRMAAGNWSMFNSRQIVREHGGDIAITSNEGKGTEVVITLPAGEHESATQEYR